MIEGPERAARAAIAKRVRTYCDEQQITPRALSLLCGWDGSHLSTVLRRLEAGKDVRTATLQTIATHMGRPEQWLKTGEMPEGIRLADLPRWSEVAAEVIERYKLSSDVLAAVGMMRVPTPPSRFDAHFLGDFARAWANAM